jgi:hypothetical protein
MGEVDDITYDMADMAAELADADAEWDRMMREAEVDWGGTVFPPEEVGHQGDEERRAREQTEAKHRQRIVELGYAIVEAGRRALTLKRHPDHGGDHEAMIELNEAVERLRSLIRRKE